MDENKYNDNGDVLDLTQDDSDSNESSRSQISRHSLESDALFDQITSTSVEKLQQKDSVVSTDSGVSTLGELSEASGTSRKRGAVGRRRSVGSLEDKSKKKSDAVLARQAKKQRLDEEKAAKRAAKEVNKIYKSGECMKHMRVEMHPSLAEAWYCADVRAELAAAGAALALDHNMCEPALVMWARATGGVGGGGQVVREPGPRALCVLPADTVAEHVRARSLSSLAARVAGMAGCPITLVVFGVRDYFRSKNRKTQNSNKFVITEIELEMAITDVLVTADCDTVIVNTPNELALLIVQHTKAIAEAPYKKAQHARDEQFDFYMRGDNRNSVTVDKDGHGLSRLWQQMIAVLPSSSLDFARVICGQYQSPLELFEVLQTSSGVQNLADIGVTRTAMPMAKSRKVGPEFAKKLQKLFVASNGDDVIQ